MQTNAEREREVEEYLATAPREVKDLAVGFKSLKWGLEEIVAYVATALKQRSDAVDVGIESELFEELEEAKFGVGLGVDYEGVRKNGLHVTTLNVELTEEQKQVVRNDLASVTTVEFRNYGKGVRVCHGVAHAFRTAMILQVYRSIPRGARVLEVGANLLSAVRRGATIGKYRGLVPILSASDAVRWNQQLRAVKVMLRERGREVLKPHQKEIAEAVVADSSVMFASMKLQDYSEKTDFITSIHSNWDIPVEDVVKAMYRTGASVYTMVLDRIPGLEFYVGKRQGTVLGLGIKWEADAETDEISFWFDHDSSFIYKHSLKTVRAYQSVAGRMFKCGGRTYMFKEAPYSTKLQLALLCVDLGVREVPCGNDVIYADSGKNGLVTITVPVRLLPTYEGEALKLDTVDFDVDEVALCRALQDRMLKGSKGSPDTVMRYVRANRVSIVHNGVRVSVNNPVAVEQFRGFSVGVDALAVDMLKASEKDAAAMVGTIANGGRKFVGPLGIIMNAVSSGTIGTGSLYQSIVLRMRQLVSEKMSGRIAVVRHSRAVAMAGRAVVDLDEASVSDENKLCYCFEREEVMSMLSGDRGGLSAAEIFALEKYSEFIQRRECVECLRGKIDVEAELSRSQEDADDIFYDCDSSLDTDEDLSDTLVSDSNASEASSATSVQSFREGEFDMDELEKDVLAYMSASMSDLSLYDRPGSAMRAAVEEYIDILRRQMVAADSESRSILKLVGMSGVIDQEGLSKYCTEKDWHTLVAVGFGGRLQKPKNDLVALSDFSRVFDYKQDKFYSVVKRDDGFYLPECCSSIVYTSYRYRIWNQPVVIKQAQSVLDGYWLDQPLIKVPFVNGVAGCGKTTGIEKAYADESRTCNRLVLTTFSESAKATRKRLFGDRKEGKDYVRTYDSLCAWSTTIKFEEVVFDEMAALHPGQLFMVLAMLQPKRVRGYGDFKQMEYCAFLGDYKPVYRSLEPFCDIEWMSHSHRLRISILASCVNFYGVEAGLSSCGCCFHSVESEEGGINVKKISGLVDVPVDKAVTYLTYTQREKQEVKTMLIGAGWSLREVDDSCMTIGESQGITRRVVYVIRLNEKWKPDSLYHEKFRVNVGKTRSTHEVRYYTVSTESDEMIKVAGDSVNENLREVVRTNTRKFTEKIQNCGGMDNYLKPYFELKEYIG